MERCTHQVESQGRLGDSLSLLDARSRRLMELWLAGRTRPEIAAEMRVSEGAVAAIADVAFRDLRQLLAGR